MAKIRVHELAKELGVKGREMAEYLKEKGYQDITAVSNVPDNEVEHLRQKYGKGEPAKPEVVEKPVEVTPKPEPEAPAAEEKPKKKTIVRVYREANATEKLQNRRPKKPSPAPTPVKEAPAKAEEKPASPVEAKTDASPVEKTPEKRAETAPVKTAEPAAKAEEKPAVKAEEKPAETAKAPAQTSQAASQSRPASQNRGDRDTRGNAGNRRPGDRNQGQGGERRPRSDGQGQRPYGNREGGQGGQRFGNRADGRQDRNGGQGRSFNREGGQGGRTGSYSSGQGQRPYGNREGGQGGRTGGYQGGQGRGPGRGPAAASAPQDSALSHKTSRDYRDKHHEKERDERRSNQQDKYGSKKDNNKSFGKGGRNNQPARPKEEPKKEKVTEITIPERLTVRELADKMKIQPSAIVKNLFMKGEMVTVNHEITFEKAQEIALEFDVIAEAEEKEDVIGALLAEEEEDEKTMVSRPPVVCVMGHVDHGKTSLLDAIRNTHVTDREAGGITQHIGAYMVSVKGQKITFLDTPGHEAFTAMRMRGANSTDIAVLVVAADDGVMPQTIEAINHAKAAGVEIIVAVNKIDKPGANIDRVKQEMMEYGLVSEEWGGSTIFCPVSAKTQEGLDDLLDNILLVAEVQELKANPNRKARGLVLEAKLDKGRGPVATILIQKGTLKQGDFIACGAASGKVRAMTDEKGKTLHKATPSMPVEIIGLSDVPQAGEVLVSLKTDKEAKEFAATFVNEGKKNLLEETRHQMSLNDLFEQIQTGSLKELPIVVKADVQGSVEAVKQSLVKLSNDEIVVKVIHGGVGAITESDVSLAAASNAIIIGFNVRPDATARNISAQQNVEIKLYNVIYQAIEDVERAIKGMRAAVYEERVTASVEILQMFKASGVGSIAGAIVRKGNVERGTQCRVFHDGEKIYEGKIKSLKRFKDDVKEVKEGFDCGIVFEDFNDFQEGDMIETFKMVEVEQD